MQPAPEQKAVGARVPGLPAVEYAERSDPGRDPDKQVNEDVCGHRQTRFGHLCVVCDGMGGHASGREAATLAASTIFDAFEAAADGTEPAALLKSAIEEASRRVHVMPAGEVALGRPGSTVVAVLMHAHGTEVAHVGDSRVYLVHEGQVYRVTRDHSVVQELVDRGLLTLQQAAHHPDANRITRALGVGPDVEAEVRPQPVHHVTGDAFVLCSDGLSDLVEDHEILAIVGSDPAAQAVGKLVDLANARGGHDNVTVVVLRARESALASATVLPPTVAQTHFTQVADTTTPIVGVPMVPGPYAHAPGAALAPASPPPQPAFEAIGDRKTEPGLPIARAVRIESLSPAPRSDVTRARRRPPAVAIVAVALAIVATVLIGAVLLGEIAERSGKRNGTSPPVADPPHVDAAAVAPPASTATTAPSTSAPPTVPPPTATTADPIAPLVPTPSGRHHPRPQE